MDHADRESHRVCSGSVTRPDWAAVIDLLTHAELRRQIERTLAETDAAE